MKTNWNRREVVKVFGTGAWIAATPPLRPAFDWMCSPLRTHHDIDALAESIAKAPRDQVFAAVAPLLEKGLTWQALEGAVFLAGVRHVRPQPVGFKLHCVLVVESVFQLAEASPEREQLQAVLWNLDDFKNSQARDVREGDWTQSRPPKVSFSSKETAVRELRAACEAWDEERTDRAVTGAFDMLTFDELFEVLWPYALRCIHNLGHKPIFATHIKRTVERIGTEHGLSPVRSLGLGLNDGAPGEGLDEFAAAREAATTMREGWSEGRRDNARSLEIALSLRDADPEDARTIVVDEINAGLDPLVIWDGLRLVATDLFARQPGLLPVHPTTVTNALFHIYTTSRNDGTRRLALLQAAGWLPLLRDALIRIVDLSMENGGIDPLLGEHGSKAVSLSDLFTTPSVERSLIALQADGALRPYASALRTHLFRGAVEHHQTKYAAALLEDVRTADARWHPILLAAALEYLPSRSTASTALFERSAELLDELPPR